MPYTDLVIDTNVLVHASNGDELRQEESVELLTYLLSSTEVICIDPEYTGHETTNTSYIGYEYLKHLKIGMLGYAFLTTMAQNQRISEVSSTVPVATTRKINQCMANNHDRVFIKVAINSNDKILVTHDFTDFAVDKRKHLKKTLQIIVVVASEFFDL